jgi:hypothetical protein
MSSISPTASATHAVQLSPSRTNSPSSATETEVEVQGKCCGGAASTIRKVFAIALIVLGALAFALGVAALFGVTFGFTALPLLIAAVGGVAAPIIYMAAGAALAAAGIMLWPSADAQPSSEESGDEAGEGASGPQDGVSGQSTEVPRSSVSADAEAAERAIATERAAAAEKEAAAEKAAAAETSAKNAVPKTPAVEVAVPAAPIPAAPALVAVKA